MKTRFAALLGAAVLLSWNGAGAQNVMHACALLTPAEVGAAVGGQAGAPQEANTVIPQGPSKGETMGTCMWATGAGSMISVAVIRAPQGAQLETGLANLNRAFDALKARGWTEDRRVIGSARCSVMTLPPAEKDSPLMTGCIGAGNGMALSVGSMGGTKQVPMEPVKALLDKALARLP